MDMVKGVLREELEDSMETQDFYRKALENLPKGNVARKNIRGQAYYYLEYREGSKVKTDYLGRLPDDKEKIEDFQKKIAERKRYKKSLMEVNQKIEYLQKALNVR
jgi:hypothetical protein